MKACYALLAVLALPISSHAAHLSQIQTVFVILLENHDFRDFHGSPDAPFLNGSLLPIASYCEQYYNPPDLHPSLPNYIWLEAGTNFDITSNEDPSYYHQSTTNHLVSLLQRAGISWRAYEEDIVAGYVPLDNTNNYAVRHNPFVYFDDVSGTNNPSYAYAIAHIRPYEELAADLTNHTVARYNFLKPNVINDGHDPIPPDFNSVKQSDTWLANEIPKILSSAAYSNNGAIFITWDEGEGDDGPIGMIVLSPLARGGGYFNNIHYSHSSFVRTMQEIFNVKPFLNDATNATDLSDLFTSFAITPKATNGAIRLTVNGVIPGRTNLVQATTNFSAWTTISTNTTSTNNFNLLDAPNSPHRFYRVRELP